MAWVFRAQECLGDRGVHISEKHLCLWRVAVSFKKTEQGGERGWGDHHSSHPLQAGLGTPLCGHRASREDRGGAQGRRRTPPGASPRPPLVHTLCAPDLAMPPATHVPQVPCRSARNPRLGPSWGCSSEFPELHLGLKRPDQQDARQNRVSEERMETGQGHSRGVSGETSSQGSPPNPCRAPPRPPLPSPAPPAAPPQGQVAPACVPHHLAASEVSRSGVRRCRAEEPGHARLGDLPGRPWVRATPPPEALRPGQGTWPRSWSLGERAGPHGVLMLREQRQANGVSVSMCLCVALWHAAACLSGNV
ncbi:basic salivary proline-rich protein 4-like [Heterocephalus glaber]|uniref:Basic salivary proline-rich protein 4-like n=1 Tax=Heterocephalus glaber TaxID=10181 RepID=A0AAX6T5C7_HETGA|nr:basic salivary proline-rich protein 4-like [Heterocephalus glaber]